MSVKFMHQMNKCKNQPEGIIARKY